MRDLLINVLTVVAVIATLAALIAFTVWLHFIADAQTVAFFVVLICTAIAGGALVAIRIIITRIPPA